MGEKQSETNRFVIHYSKKRTHTVPLRRNEWIQKSILFKHVKVETKYDETVVGYVNMFCTAEENEEPYLDSIGIISSKAARSGIELDESEIKSIEEI